MVVMMIMATTTTTTTTTIYRKLTLSTQLIVYLFSATEIT
jgi:hypothetical protein